jgi:hypothetical protein
MATWMWLNIPLLVLAFSLTVGLSYLVVLSGRRREAAPAPVRIFTGETARFTGETARQPVDQRIAA